MRRQVASLLSFSVLVLSLASCWAPYYDPEVSASVGMADKLGDPILSIGPLSGQGTFDSQQGGSFEFLPARPPGSPWAPTDGFLVQKGEDQVRITFVAYGDGSYGFASSNQNLPNFFGADALLRSEAATPGGYPQMIAMTDHAKAQQYRYDRSTRSLNQTSTTPDTSTICVEVYGFGAALRDAAADADLYAAIFSNGTQILVSDDLIGNSTLSAIPFANLFAGTLDTGGRSLSSGGSAFVNAGSGYLYYSGSGGTTLRWNMATLTSEAPALLSISKRLTAILSDGTLVAQDDLQLSAYTAGGEELFTAAAGSIRLQHEVYCSGPSPAAGYYLIFSQVLVVKGSNGSDNDEYYVKVWRCPLADFRKLGS
jgi:hypothetical protein